ncbi:unnamed protein product, partial [Mesorhabditis spiculigera]
MKVFTVGLDDKEKAKSLDEKLETGSLASSSCSEPPLKPAAQLPVATQKKCRRSPFKDMRLAFLKAILQKLKAAATDGALPGPVHVSVLEIKKQPLIGETEDDLEEPPQPAIVPDAAEAKRIDADEQPARFTDLNEEDQGDDGFEQKEQFNVPADVIADERPEVVEGTKVDEKPHSAEQQPSVVNEQPAAAIDVHPVQEPGSSGKFLPLRDSFDDPPPPAAAAPEKKVDAEPSIPAEAISDDDSFHVDKNSPFFQIDDPSSFVAKA